MANEKIIISADSKKSKVELFVNTSKFEKSLGKAEKQLKDLTNSPFKEVLSLEDNATTAIRRVMRNILYKATLYISCIRYPIIW